MFFYEVFSLDSRDFPAMGLGGFALEDESPVILKWVCHTKVTPDKNWITNLRLAEQKNVKKGYVSPKIAPQKKSINWFPNPGENK